MALKILRNDPCVSKQGEIEIKLLKTLMNSPSIVKMKTSFMFRNHICIAFELLSKNLYELLRANKFKGLPIQIIISMARQILEGLSKTHSESIIHGDLKPENILLKTQSKSGVKIIDYGSGCFSSEIVFSYIQSRFYRAPEILLGRSYGPEIDIWSFGCILFELYSGMPLFPA